MKLVKYARQKSQLVLQLQPSTNVFVHNDTSHHTQKMLWGSHNTIKCKFALRYGNLFVNPWGRQIELSKSLVLGPGTAVLYCDQRVVWGIVFGLLFKRESAKTFGSQVTLDMYTDTPHYLSSFYDVWKIVQKHREFLHKFLPQHTPSTRIQVIVYQKADVPQTVRYLPMYAECPSRVYERTRRLSDFIFTKLYGQPCSGLCLYAFLYCFGSTYDDRLCAEMFKVLSSTAEEVHTKKMYESLFQAFGNFPQLEENQLFNMSHFQKRIEVTPNLFSQVSRNHTKIPKFEVVVEETFYPPTHYVRVTFTQLNGDWFNGYVPCTWVEGLQPRHLRVQVLSGRASHCFQCVRPKVRTQMERKLAKRNNYAKEYSKQDGERWRVEELSGGWVSQATNSLDIKTKGYSKKKNAMNRPFRYFEVNPGPTIGLWARVKEHRRCSLDKLNDEACGMWTKLTTLYSLKHFGEPPPSNIMILEKFWRQHSPFERNGPLVVPTCDFLFNPEFLLQKICPRSVVRASVANELGECRRSYEDYAIGLYNRSLNKISNQSDTKNACYIHKKKVLACLAQAPTLRSWSLFKCIFGNPCRWIHTHDYFLHLAHCARDLTKNSSSFTKTTHGEFAAFGITKRKVENICRNFLHWGYMAFRRQIVVSGRESEVFWMPTTHINQHPFEGT